MGDRGLTERKPLQNINDFGKTNTHSNLDPVSTGTDQAEQQNHEVLQDEFEEGGLC